MEGTPGNYALCDHVNEVARRYGFPVRKAGRLAEGSDATYTSMVGTPSICSMGLKGGRSHSTDEYAEADSLPAQAKLLAAAVIELPEDFGVRK